MASYTDDQRAEALALHLEHGTAEAARRTGIPTRTIIRWAGDAGQTAHATRERTEEARAAAAQAVSAVWADYRSREAAAAGAAATAARRAVVDAVHEGDGSNARNLAIAYGIMIDKAELLSGNATSRIETWAQTELDRDLRALVGEMEEVVRNGHHD